MPDLGFGQIIHDKNNKLSVVITADSFVYGIFDQNDHLKLVRYYDSMDYENNNDIQAVESDVNLQGSFKNIIVCSKQLPVLHLNSPDDVLFNYFPAFSDRKVYIEKFTGEETYAYFGLKNSQSNLLHTLFSEFTLHHFSLVLSHFYYPTSKNILAAHFDEHQIHVFFQNDAGFRFYNSFRITTAKDCLYFILAAYEHLDLKTDQEPLVVSGLIDKLSPLFQLLFGYIAFIEFPEENNEHFVEISSEMKAHYYFDLFAAALCE